MQNFTQGKIKSSALFHGVIITWNIQMYVPPVVMFVLNLDATVICFPWSSRGMNPSLSQRES